MIINELKIKSKKRGIKRIGRGGKRGTYSGRGQKGQKSRSGHKIRPAERDLLQRIPKMRGFKNKPKKESSFPLNIDKIEKLGLVEISISSLKEVGVLSSKFKGKVKILGKGEIKKTVVVKNIAVSKEAKNKIEKAGGKVEN